MKINRLIAILTDFGLKDGYVGTMKGVIYGINPEVRIIDISHDISPQNLPEAFFVLKSSAKYFPVNTIFLVVVDPGVGSSRKPIIIKTSSYLFVGPDNGVCSFIYETQDNIEVIEVTNKDYFLPGLSHTFHGRDLFAPVAAYLSRGVDPYLMGKKTDNIVRLDTISPVFNSDNARGSIIYVDRFGNLITNLSKDFVEGQENIIIKIKDRVIDKLSESYSDSPSGTLLAITGSSGYLEIAVNQGNAKEALECGIGEKVYCEW